MTAPADSRHFTLQPIAEGVYAAIARDGAGAMSNAGIVDLGDRTLVFDTFMTPQAAEDLCAAAEALIGHPIAYVVNSHWHDDHVRGNQAFPNAEIAATDRTSLLMATKTPESAERYRERAPGHVAGLREQYAATSDERERARLALEISEGEEILASLPTLELRLPTHTFHDRLTFRGPAREAQLLSYGGGHTESDAFVYLPAERILFAGDLVVHRTHPWMGHGNPDEWPRILDRLEALDIGPLVPGHGPLAGRDAIGAVRAYLGDVQKLAAGLLLAGNGPDDLAQAPLPDAYAAWDAPEVFAGNMHFLGEHLAAQANVQSSPPSTPMP
ncbi:MAG TPA: MBL fold metallo-hydrolase [Ktedonobacterales bacterium]|nr:MBL fold metallo-hydrolase [Ktedonobacterales bacterium]